MIFIYLILIIQKNREGDINVLMEYVIIKQRVHPYLNYDPQIAVRIVKDGFMLTWNVDI